MRKDTSKSLQWLLSHAITVFSCVAIIVSGMAAIAYATTIGTNISTDGNLIVNGNVGIGTTSPFAKLSVAGSDTSTTLIGADALFGFIGNLLDLKVASTSKLIIGSDGSLTMAGSLTSTGTATSTFANGINITGGCILVGNNCLTNSVFSTSAWTDPITDYNASGVITTTTGTISSGTNSLSVASASGWSVGMGIAIANAGTGGNTELITYITGINGTTFTIYDNASTTATGQIVNHDDTRALQAAFDSGRNVHIRAGQYNITSTSTITKSIMITGDRAVDNLAHTSPIQSNTGGTVIWNRSVTSDVLNISSSYVTLANLAIEQKSDITPTAGYAIILGNASTRVRMTEIHSVLIYGTYGGLKVTGNVIPAFIHNNLFFTLGGYSNTSGAVYVNNPAPAGDIQWVANYFRVINPGVVVYITNADESNFTSNKISDGDPCLKIDDSNGRVARQMFSNNSFESTGTNVNPVIVISSSAPSKVYQISFNGDEIGYENGKGGILIDNYASNIIVTGVAFSTTGVPVTNNSTGPGMQIWGNSTDPYISPAQTIDSFLSQGNVGIGTTTPATTLDVNGIIKTQPASSRTCNALAEGGMMYNSGDNHFYGCNGTAWAQLDN